jgi:hypothetical protein
MNWPAVSYNDFFFEILAHTLCGFRVGGAHGLVVISVLARLHGVGGRWWWLCDGWFGEIVGERVGNGVVNALDVGQVEVVGEYVGDPVGDGRWRGGGLSVLGVGEGFVVGEEGDGVACCEKVAPMAEGEVDGVQFDVSDGVSFGWVPQVGVEGDWCELVGWWWGGVGGAPHRIQCGRRRCRGRWAGDIGDEGVVVVVFDVGLEGVIPGGKFGGPGDGGLLAFVGAVDGGDELVEWCEVELDLG